MNPSTYFNERLRRAGGVALNETVLLGFVSVRYNKITCTLVFPGFAYVSVNPRGCGVLFLGSTVNYLGESVFLFTDYENNRKEYILLRIKSYCRLIKLNFPSLCLVCLSSVFSLSLLLSL